MSHDPGKEGKWTFIDIALMILILVVCALYAVSSKLALVDDSFIYLRVAENIAHNGSWAYNIGENVNSATSTTYVLLLSAFCALFGFSQSSLQAFYFACVALFALLQFVVWRPYGRWQGFALAIMLMFGCRLLETDGMESPLLLFFVGLAAWRFDRKGADLACGVLAGLAALTRPEGLFICVFIAALEIWRTRSIPFAFLFGVALFIVPWLVFSKIYFGTLSSHTGEAKALQRHIAGWAKEPNYSVAYLVRRKLLLASVLVSMIILLVRKKAGRENFTFTVVVTTFGVAQWAAYSVLNAPDSYFWYFTGADFGLMTFVAYVVASTWQPRLRLNLFGIVATCVAFLLMRPTHLFLKDYRLAQNYKDAAEWIRDHSAPGDVIAATEIGYFGWFSGRNILDVYGLIHERALPSLRVGNLHWWWDDHERPRFIILHEPSWDGEPGSPATWPSELTAQFSSDYFKQFASASVAVYVRRNGAAVGSPPAP